MNKEEILEKAKYYANYIKCYQYISMVFEFDHETIAPKNGLEEGDEAMSQLSNDIFKVFKSDDYTNFVKEAYEKRNLFDKYQRRAFELNYRSFYKNINKTPEFQYEESLTVSRSFTIWREAKDKSDYSIFEPALSKAVDIVRKEIELRPYHFKTPYDTLLDDYEPGENEEFLDYFFSELKKGIIPLVKKINAKKEKIRTDFMSYKVAIPKQEKLAKYFLKFNGFDMDSGVLSTTEHPFTTFPSHHDVRVTTHYYENNFISNIFSVIHEGGHAIFAQNEPDKFYDIALAGNQTSAQHETISRFYENIIARNPNYIEKVYKKVQSSCGKKFKDVSLDEFYKAVNIVTPSLIRTESDELTYCLHIIIRYELEKDLINGKIETKGLNEEWNKKYLEYLGVKPSNDKEGILQDVHWSQASFGYFPSYALGNAYGAQILSTMKKELDIDETIKKGQMSKIKNWLKKNVFNSASLLDPSDWVKAITGEELNPKYYLDYLTEKYSKIYNL